MGDIRKSCSLQLQYLDLCNDLFIDVNPIPCKEAMVMMGWPVGECRMPLVGLSESNRAKLQATLKRHKLI